MTSKIECKKCGHIHAYDDFCGVILSADEDTGIIYADCPCSEEERQ